MREPKGWNAFQTEKPGRFDATVAGNDFATVVDKHRVSEAKAPYAAGDLADLLFRVGPRIAFIGHEPVYC